MKLHIILLMLLSLAALIGSNFIFGNSLIESHYVVQKQNVDMGFFVLSPHIASLFFVVPITLLTGFLLNRFIVFSESNLPAGVQLFRYLSVWLMNLLLTYLMMKLFVDMLDFYPTPSRVLTMAISVLFSKQLLAYPAVTYIDAMIARFLLNLLTSFFKFIYNFCLLKIYSLVV